MTPCARRVPSAVDPFAVLDVPRRYDLDRRTVESAHLRLLAALHPDRIADPIRRAEAVSATADANEARDILLDDERRAETLLTLLGGAPHDSERSLPPGFLVEVLELREKLDEAIAAEDPTLRDEFERMIAAERAVHRDTITELFARLRRDAPAARAIEAPASPVPATRCADIPSAPPGTAPAPSADQATLRAIRLHLNSWRYIERMHDTLRGAAVE